MLWIDEKFASLVAARLDRFKKRGGGTYNFRCPFCDDSQKSKSKARGYFLPHADHLSYFCHNCGVSTSFAGFLRRFDPHLYDEYRYESLTIQGKDASVVKVKRLNMATDPFASLTPILDLPEEHIARVYLHSRRLPDLSRFRYTKTFNAYVNGLIPEKMPKEGDEPRIVIPLVTKQGGAIGFQGRSLKANASVRYISICLDKDLPMLFGMEKVDLSRRFYVTEGPFDSCFLDNGMAACGSSILTTIERLPAVKDKAVIILDNEPRNAAMVGKLEACIKAGYQVVIWPSDVQAKDINDLILDDWSPAQVQHMLDANIHQGMKAQLVLAGWRRS